jgi:hypothetical protein
VKTGTFYLIVSSLKTRELAQSELMLIKRKGYSKALIIEADGVFRIAAESFDSENEARKKQKELNNDFPGIWVYKSKK